MSQADVIKILRKHPDRWFTRQEIAKMMKNKCNINNVSNNLLRLYKRGEIFKKYKRIERSLKKYAIYRYVRG